MISTALGMVITADGILTVLLTIVLHRSRTGFKSYVASFALLSLRTLMTLRLQDRLDDQCPHHVHDKHRHVTRLALNELVLISG